MKSLYESILDDEDVLFTDIKNTINNPFIIIHNMFENNEDQSNILKRIEDGLLDDFLKGVLFIDRKKDILDIEVRSKSKYFLYNGLIFYWGKCGDYCKLVYITFMPDFVSIEYVTNKRIDDELNDPKISAHVSKKIVNSKFYKYNSKIEHNFKKFRFESRFAASYKDCERFTKKYQDLV